MHELVVNDWLDHDYIERHVDGWPKLSERALRVAARARGRGVRHRRRADSLAGARLRHDPAGGDPRQLRHAARARRRQRAAADRDPAVPGRRLAPPRRRPAAVGVGLVPARAQRRRAAAPRSARRAPAANDQHEHDRRRPAARERRDARRRPRFGPRIEALVVYNSNPVAVAPDSAKVARGFGARRPVHGRARALHDRHRRPRRLRPAGDDAARAPRRPHRLRPHLRDDQRAGDRAARRGASRTRRSFARWPSGWASTIPAFATTTRRWRGPPFARRPKAASTSTLARRRLGQARHRRGAVRRGRLSDAERQVPDRRARASAFPTTSPTTNRRSRAPISRAAIRWR